MPQVADWFSKLRAVYRLGAGIGVVVVVVVKFYLDRIAVSTIE